MKWDNISVYLMNYLPLSTLLPVVYSTLVVQLTEPKWKCDAMVLFTS